MSGLAGKYLAPLNTARSKRDWVTFAGANGPSLLVVAVSILGRSTNTRPSSGHSIDRSGGSGPDRLASRLTGATTAHSCPSWETARTNCLTNTPRVGREALGYPPAMNKILMSQCRLRKFEAFPSKERTQLPRGALSAYRASRSSLR